MREVRVVDASACVALTSAGLAVGGAGLVEPCGGRVEGRDVGLAVVSCAERARACGGPVAAASVDLAVDELEIAGVAGSAVADAVLEGMVVSGKDACVGRCQPVPRASEPSPCPSGQLEICSLPGLDHHQQLQLQPLRRLPRRRQRLPCEVYPAADRCQLASWLLTASSALVGGEVDR